MWEEGKGPGQVEVAEVTPIDAGFQLGDFIGRLISIATFGLVKPWPGCGCDKRRAWLNRFGDRLKFWRHS